MSLKEKVFFIAKGNRNEIRNGDAFFNFKFQKNRFIFNIRKNPKPLMKFSSLKAKRFNKLKMNKMFKTKKISDKISNKITKINQKINQKFINNLNKKKLEKKNRKFLTGKKVPLSLKDYKLNQQNHSMMNHSIMNHKNKLEDDFNGNFNEFNDLNFNYKDRMNCFENFPNFDYDEDENLFGKEYFNEHFNLLLKKEKDNFNLNNKDLFNYEKSNNLFDKNLGFNHFDDIQNYINMDNCNNNFYNVDNMLNKIPMNNDCYISNSNNINNNDYKLQGFDPQKIQNEQKKVLFQVKTDQYPKFMDHNSKGTKSINGLFNMHDSLYESGRWTQNEHILFIEAMIKFGLDWKEITKYIGTRSTIQIRSHAQKFFIKLKKDKDGTNFLGGILNGKNLSIDLMHQLFGNLPEDELNKVVNELSKIFYEQKDMLEKQNKKLCCSNYMNNINNMNNMNNMNSIITNNSTIINNYDNNSYSSNINLFNNKDNNIKKELSNFSNNNSKLMFNSEGIISKSGVNTDTEIGFISGTELIKSDKDDSFFESYKEDEISDIIVGKRKIRKRNSNENDALMIIEEDDFENKTFNNYNYKFDIDNFDMKNRNYNNIINSNNNMHQSNMMENIHDDFMFNNFKF